MAREDLHFRLRIPEQLKKRIEESAEKNQRSMTAEMVERLDWSFDRALEEKTHFINLVHQQDAELRILRAEAEAAKAEAEKLSARLQDEQEAFIRMQQLYENMAEVAAGFKEVSRGANTHLLGQIRLVEALCSIVLSLDAAPSADIIEIVKRMQKAAEDARERFSIPELMQPTSTPTES